MCIRDSLYLVNASESPAAVAYVEAEMQILSWVEKPVLVLLNQMGKPRPNDAEEKDQAAWCHYMERFPIVFGILPMDAFARCWIQEIALFEMIGRAIPVSYTHLDVYKRQGLVLDCVF